MWKPGDRLPRWNRKVKWTQEMKDLVMRSIEFRAKDIRNNMKCSVCKEKWCFECPIGPAGCGICYDFISTRYRKEMLEVIRKSALRRKVVKE